MFLEAFLGFIVVIFIVYFFIGIEMPGISWFSPGKWSFCASNGKISEFKTCHNKFTWTSCSQNEHEEYAPIFTGKESFYGSMMRSSPMGILLPRRFPGCENLLERIWNFKPRKDDIWIVTYAKSGTTLTQELMWQIANGVDLEHEESKKHLLQKSPFLEFSLLACDWWLASIPTSLLRIFSRLSKLNRFFKKLFGIFELAEIIQDTVTWTENLKSPRIIKTHLPLSMLPPSLLETSKVLYVGRNVKDACVSYFYHEKLIPLQGMRKDYPFEDYAMNLYKEGKVLYGPYWEHINDAWEHRNHSNFKFLWYEDMIENKPKLIQEIADFTNFKLSKQQVNDLAEHCSIKSFKKNETVNMKDMLPEENGSFIRKGEVGDWMNHFKDPEKLREFDQWITDNNKHDIPIRYKL